MQATSRSLIDANNKRKTRKTHAYRPGNKNTSLELIYKTATLATAGQ